MIATNQLTVDFGKRLLFDNVSFVIGDKERVALAGRNGAGKSTLLKLLVGDMQPTSGTVSRSKHMEIGYLPQVMNITDSRTLWEEAESVFEGTKRRFEELDRMAQQLAEREDHDSDSYHHLIERYTTLSERLHTLSESSYQADIEKTLIGLGFERSDFARPTSEFSGGWRMRVELAKILLAKPDLLLLDEPTNHLDIESIAWLEQFIKQSGCALLLVSHDRFFLDAVTTRTIEIELGKIYDYPANYTKYLQLRQERIEMQRRAFENQRKMIQETEAFIERFRYKATKAVQVQSRIKQLEKIERIEIDEVDTKAMHFRFPVAERSGDYPLIAEGLSKSFGHIKVFEDIDMIIRRGEKVAFVGKNGSGKTTFIRCVMGQLTDYSGHLKIGHNIKIAYFSQNRARELDPALTIRETIDREAVGDVRLRINDLLGAFMFGGEVADKPVSVLSGGERSRLAILLLLLEPANMLILDEPTNHLDILSKEILKQAIAAFEGTVLVVSHDRYFLTDLVSKVYEFGHHTMREYLGGMQEYLEKKALQAASPPIVADKEKDTTNSSRTEPDPSLSSREKESARLSYEERKDLQKKARQATKDLADAERRVANIEEALAAIELQIAHAQNLPPDSPLFTQYKEMQTDLEDAMKKWEMAELNAEKFR